MTRFTKEQMLDELRTIFLFEAAHIVSGAGSAAAEAFIGFKPENLHGFAFTHPGDFLGLSPSQVDLDRFPIAAEFERAYDFVYRPSKANYFGPSSSEILDFMNGIPRGAAAPKHGESSTHRFMGPDGYCQTVGDSAFARWKLLDADPKEFEHTGGISFSTRELGLLAQMSEGAVRNALADKGENGLTAIPGEKPVKVSRDEARRWLSGRRGFLQAPDRPRDDISVREALTAVKTVRHLAEFIDVHLASFDDLDVWDYPEETLNAWRNGRISTDLTEIRAFANAIEVDVPLFVGKVFEAVERREAAAQGGQS